jgi:opacity protein-like surface antigen
MRKIFFTAWILVILGSSIVNGQTPKKFYNTNELELLFGTGTNDSNTSAIGGFRIRTGLATTISHHIGLGLSIGTDSYRESKGAFKTRYYNTLPFVAKIGYFKKPDFSGLNADLYTGYALGITSNYEEGITFGTGVGYNFKSRKHSNFGVQTGYNFQQINDGRVSNNQLENLNLHSIRLGIKLIFK